MEVQFFYQIDFIDERGFANYINTFNADELDKAKEHWKILSNALSCITKDTKYVLDMYAQVYDTEQKDSLDETSVLVAQILPEMELKL